MSENELDDRYREGLDRLSDDDLPWDKTPTWEQLDQALNQRNRRRTRGLWWRIAAGLTLAIGLGWLAFRGMNQPETRIQTATVRRTQAPASTAPKTAEENRGQTDPEKTSKPSIARAAKPFRGLSAPGKPPRTLPEPTVTNEAEPLLVTETAAITPELLSATEVKSRTVSAAQPAPIRRAIESIRPVKTDPEPTEELIMPPKKRFQLPIALAPHLTRPTATASLPTNSREKAPVQLQISL
ncbi:hypothetical protein ACFQ4C_16195 [Larkinella insperata]|uniref:Uncharacterized protein n=1 Tax=Larkinella insperata TaxID=332158 RepID=A0ABW3QEC4_9BACT|nr:hypothetical protein [Larkinella insperata]